MKKTFILTAVLTTMGSSTAMAHHASFKTPVGGMHFTQGQPVVGFAYLEDSRGSRTVIVCPTGQTVSNYYPSPVDYNNPTKAAECSGGGNPSGWPQFQVLVDGSAQIDRATGNSTLQSVVTFDANDNPDPGNFHPFSFSTAALSVGSHQFVIHGLFSQDGTNVATQDSAPLTIYLDAPPAKSTVTLNSNFSGTVNWNNVIVVGNGHSVTASGSLVIKDSLVTGISGLGGQVTDADIEGSIFEDDGPLDKITLGSGSVVIKNNELRANNRLTFASSNPSIPVVLNLDGSGTNQKLFQGNRVAAGITNLSGQNWLIGGDADDKSNIFMGPRCVLQANVSNSRVVGNYGHHEYADDWSQGYNFYYETAGTGVLTEHNFIRNGSWPIQWLAGEFRYNVVYGYGHTWIRSTKANASIHHNIFTPGGNVGLSAGIQCYGGESGLLIYNNTFDGGGKVFSGDAVFAGPTIDMSGGSQVSSLRNNLITFSRNTSNDSPGSTRVTGGASSYLYADYNAFYSPDNSTKINYDFTAGAHDVSGTGQVGVTNGQLAASPFAGARVYPIDDYTVIDEPAVWAGTQKVSQILAIFRARYTPAAGSPVIDTGDPGDNDSQGRRADIGAVDVGGHDQDKIGKFGTPPTETTPPTVSLTAPSAGATVTGVTTLKADASDSGSGVVLVQFLVDGAVVGQDASAPYQFGLDVTAVRLSTGDHSFSAKAWDAAGNFAVSASVTVHVAGDTTPPSAPTNLVVL